MEELVCQTLPHCLEFDSLMSNVDSLERERNQCSFEDVELSFVHLKSSFIITLFKWSCLSSHREIHSIIDSIHSLSF